MGSVIILTEKEIRDHPNLYDLGQYVIDKLKKNKIKNESISKFA